ncbi:MAG: Uma2 family endonuclease, partial [Acidimicrobiales bacterium]
MRVLTGDPPPAELEAVIERRRALGQDRFDEVWEGVYHMTPGPSGWHAYLEVELIVALRPFARAAGLIASGGFNLGDGPQNFRVPDGGYHRRVPTGVWIPTAAIVVEIVSPDDETYAKFDFYAGRVDEILLVDSPGRAVAAWRVTSTGEVVPADGSALLDVSTAQV